MATNSGIKSSATFDKLLNEACSLVNIDRDTTEINVWKCINEGDVQPEYVFNAFKKKLSEKNPDIVCLALDLIESCYFMCNSTLFHNQLLTQPFLDELRKIESRSVDENIKKELHSLIMVCSQQNQSEMNETNSAPEWVDGDQCHECLIMFSMFRRKHHCRNCGQIFCSKCTSKQSSIPSFGFQNKVRVCDECHDILNQTELNPELPDKTPNKPVIPESPQFEDNSRSFNISNKIVDRYTETQILEELEDLQLAIAISQSETEAKKTELSVVNKKLIGNTSLSTKQKQGNNFIDQKLLNKRETRETVPLIDESFLHKFSQLSISGKTDEEIREEEEYQLAIALSQSEAEAIIIEKRSQLMDQIKSSPVIDENRLLCKICMDQEISVLFMPCRHQITCTECAPKLEDCPVCRTYIRETITVFLQ